MISPTRELALQIKDVAEKFVANDEHLHLLSLVGGTEQQLDITSFQSVPPMRVSAA
jgi:superfamily II DNA/RNA helicase